MALFQKRLIFFIVPIITLPALFFFRTVPRAKIWKSYKVVAIEKSYPDDTAIKLLSELGCKNIISLSTQSVPLANEFFGNISYLLPYITSIAQESGSYLSERDNYFFDKSKNFRLYYVPSEYGRAAATAVNSIVKSGYTASLDTSVKFPWLSPIVCLIAFFVPLIFCKRKIIYTLAAIFPILLSWSFPFYAVSASAAFTMPVIFSATGIMCRKDSYRVLAKSPIILLLIVALVISFVSAFIAGFLFILCVASSASVFVLSEIIWNIKYPQNFRIFIVPTHIVLKTEKKIKTVFLVSVSNVALLVICFFFNSLFLPLSTSMELPSHKSKAEQNLPGLDEYLSWVWNVQTYPYMSLSGSNYSDESVVFPRYTENGTMIQQHNEVFLFDGKYKKTVIDSIDALPHTSVEKLLKIEGVYGRTGYSSSGSNTDGVKTIALLVCALIAGTGILFAYSCYAQATDFWSKK